MNPGILLVPLAGLLLVLLALALTGGWRTGSLSGPDEVRRVLDDDYPEFRAARIELAEDGQAAIAFGEDAAHIVLFLYVGDRLTTRTLHTNQIKEKRVTLSDQRVAEVILELPYIAFPEFRMRVLPRTADGVLAALQPGPGATSEAA